MLLSTYRKKKRLTLDQLAERFGVRRSVLHRACHGLPISRKNAEKIEDSSCKKILAVFLVYPKKVQR